LYTYGISTRPSNIIIEIQIRMNVLQINSLCGLGSTGRIATDLHTFLIARGHQSTVAFGRDTAENCRQTIHIGGRFDNYLHVVRTRLLDQHGFGSAIATKTFIEKIKELNPDVIHLHNLHGYYLHIGLLFEYLKQANKPVVWTLHDCWAFTGHCTYFDFWGCDRWKSECHHCPLKEDYPASFFLDRSQWNYQRKQAIFTGVQALTIVTPSIWLKNLVQASFLREYPVQMINNGIDLSIFKSTPNAFRKRYSLENQFMLLGVAFAWEERKGLGYFLEIAKQLHPDEKIILVGLTKKQIRQLPSEIIGIPKTSNRQELAEIYSSADLFVNPTLEEVLGLVNLEALACGNPVITFNSGGSPECLDDGCGVVVERGDLPGLVAAIALVRKNGKEFYAAHCRKRAQDWFDKDVRFTEYVVLYEAMLKSGRAKAGNIQNS
jgi:putative colanic acid biosynthesis glycosyltransferase